MRTKLLVIVFIFLSATIARGQQPPTIGVGVPEVSLTTASNGLVAGTTFTIPSNSTLVSWNPFYNVTPSAVVIVIQGSYDNSNFFTLDTSVNVNSEIRTFLTAVKYIRCTQSSRTGGSTTTCTISVKPTNVAGSVVNTQSVAFADGAVGNPSITFVNDTGTGFWRGGSSDIRFSNSGVAQFRLVSNNLVFRDAENIAWSSTADPSASVAAYFYKVAATSVIGVNNGANNFAFQTGGFNLNRSNTMCLGWANGDPGITSTDTQFCSGGAAGKVQLTGATPMFQFGGTTGSFPALKQVSTGLYVRTANDGGYSQFGAGEYQLGGVGIYNTTAPTISSGFGTSPAILSNNGNATFRVNVGTGGVATSGVIGLPTFANGWNCQVTDMTTNIVTRQTASTTNTVTVTAASAWGASDTLIFNCIGY